MDILDSFAVQYCVKMMGRICGVRFAMYFINKGRIPSDRRMKVMLVIILSSVVVLLAQPLGESSFHLTGTSRALILKKNWVYTIKCKPNFQLIKIF